MAGGNFLIDQAGDQKIFIREDFNEQQSEIGQTVADFMTQKVLPEKKKIETLDYALTRRLMKEAGELGFLSVEIPEKFGGMEMDKVTSTIVTENLSYCQSASFATTFACHIGIGSLPIIMFGTDAQKARYLPKLGSGEFLGAYALTEPEAGSDALSGKANAILSEDKKFYILNGTKQFITNAGFADTFVVFAKIDGEKFTAFIVEKNTPGLTIGPEEKKMGLKGSSTCSVILENAKVPAENLLGEIGRGSEIAFNILNIGRFKLGAADLGACKHCVGESARYALQRKQFGQPIANFEAIKSKIANMTVRTFALDSVIYRTVGMIDDAISKLDKNDPAYARKVVDAIEEYAIEASIAKVFGSESLFFCSDNGIQVFGGYGFSEEYPMAAVFRDNRVDRIFEGTNEINRQIISGYFLKKALQEELPIRTKMEALEVLLHKGFVDIVSDVLKNEKNSLEWAKTLTLFTFNEAICRFGQDLKNRHQIGEALADMFGDIYALDSILSRITQLHERGMMKPIHKAIGQVFAAEAAMRIEPLSRMILCSCHEGINLEHTLEHYNKYAEKMHLAADTYQRKNQIAEYVYEHEKYPF